MRYRIYLATVALAVFALAAQPAAAQGYAGVLPAESNGAPEDKSALPFMSSQMGKQETGGSAKVTEGAGGADQDMGGNQTDGDGVGDEQATADDIVDEDGDGQPDAPDMADLYGLNGDTTLSTDNQGEPVGKTGFMAMIGGGDDKGAKKIDTGALLNDPAPENLYRAMEGGEKDDAERARLRMNRELETARAAHDKEIDEMNAARMRDHQVRAQAEIDRVTAIQQEAMAKVRERMGTATPEETELSDGGEPLENAEGESDAGLANDDTGNTAE